MSSDRFARSRPRVRHQRAPRTHSCDHPRFLQLVNELTRINEAKKKQDEIESNVSSISDSTVANLNSNICSRGPDSNIIDKTERDSSSCGNNLTAIPNNADYSCANGRSGCNSNCCNPPLAHTSNCYRALDATNQSSSVASHDNYYQSLNHHNANNHLVYNQNTSSNNYNHPHYSQNTNSNNHNHHHQHHTSGHHHLVHNHHDLIQSHDQLSQHSSNNLHNQDVRCQNKNSSANNFGYSKQGLVEHNNTEHLNAPDLRQDENRSKRKRSSNDPSNSRKSSSSCTSAGTSSKRHKSSPELTRPLSPSFTKCPICLLDCMDRDPSFTNTCFHLFCYVCIENWTKNKATCPLCRTKFTKIIYNIKSATNYEEKIASPVRRDDDDGYITDRLMFEHLSSFNTNSAVSNRNINNEEVQFLFDNLRGSDVLMPQYLINQIDPRQNESLHSFNSVSAATNFNSNVPHPQFNHNNYPIASNYIALLPNRPAPPPSTAISSAYNSNASMTNLGNDPNARRSSRSSSRFLLPRSYDTAALSDASSRTARTTATSVTHHHHHPHTQRPLDIHLRPNQRIEQSHAHMHLPYNLQTRQYNPDAYARRSYNNPLEQQRIIDAMYGHMPEL